MKINYAIQLTNLSKEYPVFKSAFEKLKYLSNIILWNKSSLTKTKVRALSNINLKVKKGERLGIVGDMTLMLKEDELHYSMGYIDDKYWKKY